MLFRYLSAPLAALLIVGGAAGAASASAQAPGAGTGDEDASVAQRGAFRLRVFTSWTRFDAVYGVSSNGKPVPWGSLFSTDSLGVTQVPALAPNEAALRAVTGGSALRLNLGRLTTSADARVVNVPMELQYGMTSRLALSVMVPFVQTRATVIAGMNTRCSGSSCLPYGAIANVGPNPRDFNSVTTLQRQITDASTQLSNALQNCQTNPVPACSSQAQAQQLLSASAAFSSSVAALYGNGTTTGQPFVPLARSALDTLIRNEVSSFNSQFRTLLGSSNDLITTTPTGAAGPIGTNELGLIGGSQFGVGFDSIGTSTRIGIGDVELGMAYKLLDELGDSAVAAKGGLRARAAVQGVLRLGTGSPSDPTLPFDIGTGQGQMDVEARAMLDVRGGGRLAATVAGSYSNSITSAHLVRAPQPGGSIFPLVRPYSADWKPGNVVELFVAPRFLATEDLAIVAQYVMRHTTADLVTPTTYTTRDSTLALQALPAPYVSLPASTEQRFGIGFTYSALQSYTNGRSPVPLEMFFQHLETVHASGFTQKYFRDQLGFRLYYQWRKTTKRTSG